MQQVADRAGLITGFITRARHRPQRARARDQGPIGQGDGRRMEAVVNPCHPADPPCGHDPTPPGAMTAQAPLSLVAIA